MTVRMLGWGKFNSLAEYKAYEQAVCAAHVEQWLDHQFQVMCQNAEKRSEQEENYW